MRSLQNTFVEGGIFQELIREASADGQALVAEAARIADHQLYHVIRTPEQVRRFMEYHVWCVWDFMSLAKSVQLAVGCFQVPWLPPKDASLVAAINDIVRGEEADIGPDGNIKSHFEIYLDAMRLIEADCRGIDETLKLVAGGQTVPAAMSREIVPSAAKRFVETTLRCCSGPPHVRVAAFCLGREELVPTMFTTFLRYLPHDDPKLSSFLWYVRRHVDLDSHQHGPLSARLFRATVGSDPQKRQEALQAGLEAVRARALYLDQTLTAITKP